MLIEVLIHTYILIIIAVFKSVRTECMQIKYNFSRTYHIAFEKYKIHNIVKSNERKRLKCNFYEAKYKNNHSWYFMISLIDIGYATKANCILQRMEMNCKLPIFFTEIIVRYHWLWYLTRILFPNSNFLLLG